MRAAVLVAKERLELQEVPDPAREEDGVVIRVDRAAICNTTDLKILSADDPTKVWPFEPWPLVLGHEICGEIEFVGDAVEGWAAGDRIAGWGLGAKGGFAERFALKPSAAACVRVPPDMPSDTASLLEIALGTARYLYSDACQERLPRDGTAYVVGLGPCGLAYVLNLANMGVAVYASGRHADRRALAREFGAVEVFEPEEDPVGDLVARGVQVDVACDTTGRDFTDDLLRVVRPGGAIVPFGGGWNAYAHAGPFAERDILLAAGGVQEARRAASDLLDWYRRGRLPIDRIISHRIRLDELAEGFELVRDRRAVKVVVEV